MLHSLWFKEYAHNARLFSVVAAEVLRQPRQIFLKRDVGQEELLQMEISQQILNSF